MANENLISFTPHGALYLYGIWSYSQMSPYACHIQCRYDFKKNITTNPEKYPIYVVLVGDSAYVFDNVENASKFGIISFVFYSKIEPVEIYSQIKPLHRSVLNGNSA